MQQRSEAQHHGTRRPNRLAAESSPYLLQHAHNPVDWYPWGEEAFAAARSADKPIFLSVGYSTCHWCHVMERQSFEDPAVAREMNERFVNIKVDREQRPDVDQLYMSAVQLLTRQGGWPLSAWLMPDLRPFYGGTYFPPQDVGQRPGFLTILRALSAAYRDRPSEVQQTAAQLQDILAQLAEPPGVESPVQVDEALVARLIDRSTADHDPRNGGFGSAPKFPRQTLLELLLTWAGMEQTQSEHERRRALGMVQQALLAMANGGIRDQLGGAFHRYSTDERWLVPHFEIMLYDNAMLAWCYVELYRQTEDRRAAHIARGILDFVLDEITSPEGAFYTALDADADGREGLTYLWTAEQVRAVLGERGAGLFGRVYGLEEGPNFADPHSDSEPDSNVLYVADPAEAESHEAELEPMRRQLLEARQRRPQPMLDTKIVTSWNALMIRSLAYAGQVLAEPRYIGAAGRAAAYLLRAHRLADGSLIRSSGGSRLTHAQGAAAQAESAHAISVAAGESVLHGAEAPLPADAAAAGTPLGSAHPPDVGAKPVVAGFLDDYAFMIQALLALRDAGSDEGWLDHARMLCQQMISRFGDPQRGGFYFSEQGAGDLIVRQKVGSDSPLPSGSAVAASVLLDLGHADLAQRTIAAFTQSLLEQGEGMSAMVQAALRIVHQQGSFAVQPRATGASAGASGRPAALQRSAEEALALSAEWLGERRLKITAHIAPGMHINAHDVAGGLVPTRVTAGAGTEVEGIDYPPGELRTLPLSDSPISLYEGDAVFTVRFARAPIQPVHVSITYQACDDSSCLPPVTVHMDAAR